MTLAELYSFIDWSETEQTLARWKTLAMPSIGVETPEDFQTRFRYALLLYALPTEIVGEQEGWSIERQQSARYALGAAGVWNQVVDYLIERGLLGPLEAEEASHLTLSFGD